MAQSNSRLNHNSKCSKDLKVSRSFADLHFSKRSEGSIVCIQVSSHCTQFESAFTEAPEAFRLKWLFVWKKGSKWHSSISSNVSLQTGSVMRFSWPKKHLPKYWIYFSKYVQYLHHSIVIAHWTKFSWFLISFCLWLSHIIKNTVWVVT